MGKHRTDPDGRNCSFCGVWIASRWGVFRHMTVKMRGGIMRSACNSPYAHSFKLPSPKIRFVGTARKQPLAPRRQPPKKKAARGVLAKMAEKSLACRKMVEKALKTASPGGAPVGLNHAPFVEICAKEKHYHVEKGHHLFEGAKGGDKVSFNCRGVGSAETVLLRDALPCIDSDAAVDAVAAASGLRCVAEMNRCDGNGDRIKSKAAQKEFYRNLWPVQGPVTLLHFRHVSHTMKPPHSDDSDSEDEE